MSIGPLDEQHRNWLISEAFRLANMYRDVPSRRTWAKHQLKEVIFWYWSVDGLQGGVVKREVVQNRGRGWAFQLASHTAAAKRESENGGQIRRDHAVPRKELLKMVLEAGSEEMIGKLLLRYCFVVLVTEDEHYKLHELSKDSMPVGWDCRPLLERDPWARYRPGLIETIKVHETVPRPEP